MKYTPPPGSVDPDAPYVTGNAVTRVKGSPVPAEAVENPQREIVKVISEAGLDPSNSDLTQLFQALEKMYARPHYDLLQFCLFRHPDLAAGFEALDGGVIENGAEMYPEAWTKLQTTWGQKLCKTAAEREELANHVYYTLADGTEITYGGIGGVPFYTIDAATGSITMPDIRGMHLEAAGFLDVGAVAIDQARGWWADLGVYAWAWRPYSSSGAVTLADQTPGGNGPSVDYGNTTYEGYMTAKLRPEMQIPIGGVNRPRSLGMLACAWMGLPAL